MMPKHLFLVFVAIVCFGGKIRSQAGVGSGNYCMPTYWNIPCNQPNASNNVNNYVNDFIDDFSTTGGLTNITTNNTGCQTQAISGTQQNFYNYACPTHLRAAAGANITCTFKSGITYGQGFAVFIDYNKDCVYSPSEMVCGTPNVPPPATATTAVFQVPGSTVMGAYKMRVRCSYATVGTSIDPCAQYSFGENQEYTMFVGTVCSGTLSVCSALPVELASFHVMSYDKYAEITWSTLSERNSDHFTLERSYDYVHFEPVQKLEAAGTTSGTNYYRVMDMKLNRSGYTYYRLKQYDIDGRLSYEQTISLLNKSATWFEVKLMPTVAEDEVKVEILQEFADGGVEIEVLDVGGSAHFRKNYSASEIKAPVILPVGNLEKGLYFLNVRSSEGRVIQSKIIKN